MTMQTGQRTRRPAGTGMALGCVLALALAGVTAAPLTADAGATKRGGRVVIISAQEPRTLMPHLDLLTLSREAQRLVFDGPLTLDDKGDYPDFRYWRVSAGVTR